jgi:integrase
MAQRIKFTDSAIASLPIPPDGERVEFADTMLRGLRVRVSPSGIKTFSLLRRVRNGPMERCTLGRFPDDLKTEAARTKAQQLNGVIAGGANPGEVKRAHKGEPTFAKLFAEYIERHATPNKRTWREDEQKYRDYLQPIARKKVSKITRQDLASIHSQLTGSGHPTLANRVKDLMSSVFSKAVSWGYLESNPAKGIEDNREKSRERFLKPGELPRVFAALAGEPNANFRDYFLMAMLTGARRANVRAMRWRDVDIEQREWRIPTTKNDAPLTVPLVPEAVAILKMRQTSLGAGRYVFPADRSDSKNGYMSGERKAWLRVIDRDELAQLRQRITGSGHRLDEIDGESLAKALVRAHAAVKRLKLSTEGARIEDIRIHDLRRTLGSWQARTGASLVIIGKTLGHKSQQASAVYARLDTDPVRQAMETATSALLEAAGMKKPAEIRKIGRRASSAR